MTGKGRQKANKTSLVDETRDMIEGAVGLGRFIRHYEESDYIGGLEDVREYLRGMSTDKRFHFVAAELYEYFIASCYEKIEEVETETEFHSFVESLFADWIHVRQLSGCNAEDTLRLLSNWEQDDSYCLCISPGEAAKAMDRASRKIYKKHLYEKFEQSFVKEPQKDSVDFAQLSWNTRKSASALKDVYCVTKDANAYSKLCEKLETSPRDCENIANIFKEKRNYDAALQWIEKGITQGQQRDWRNQYSYALEGMKIEVLAKVGRKQESMRLMWQRFQDNPCDIYYNELMKYVPSGQKAHWRNKAIKAACGSTLDDGILRLLSDLNEFEKLAQLIVKSDETTMENLFYYDALNVAEKLEEKHKKAAAKLYLALTMNIVKAGRSKAYKYALKYCEKLKILYEETKQQRHWEKLLDYLQGQHSRKYSLMDGLEKVIEGTPVQERNTLQKRVNQRLNKIRQNAPRQS